MNRILRTLALLVVSLSLSPATWAQATRTWVSGVGDDANPCSRTAPCKSFAGAISKTAAFGEINVLDGGGYGGATITKSITIDGGGGALAGALVAGTSGFIVNGTGINVTLRNLTIDGLGTTGNSTAGVNIIQGAFVSVEKCTILGFRNVVNGVGILMTGAGQLHVSDTTITDANIGVQFNSSNGQIVATLDNVRIHNTTSFGVQAANVAESIVLVRNSNINNNSFNGVHAAGPGSIITVVDSSISFNSGTAVNAAYPGALIRLSGNVITNNGNGIGWAAGGTVASDGTNRIGGVSVLPPNATFLRQ